MITRKGPDGKSYQFQDGTTEQEMAKAFTSIYGGPEKEVNMPIIDKVAGTVRATGQGLSVGSLDEGMGALGAFAQTFIPEGLSPYSTDYNQNFNAIQQEESRKVKDFRDKEPALAIGGELAGAILSPAAKLAQVGKFTNLKPTGKAALDSMAFAMPYAFMSADGSVLDRGKDAAIVAIPALLFGAGSEKMMKVGKGVFDRFFSKSVKTPTIDNLKKSKTEAYKFAEISGERYAPAEIGKMVGNIERNLVKNQGYSQDIDKQALAAFNLINKQKGKELTLTELDKVRQGLWQRHTSGTDAEKTIIRDMIDEVDDAMFAHTGSTEVMQIARHANSLFKKSELLDEAFKKAELQTAGSGSGGNIFNKYRQAVTNIMINPKNSRWFSVEEKKQMEVFVRGDFGVDVMRNIGKLSPTGNGLMTALNIGAIATNPAMAAVTVAGAGAKALSDRGIMRQKKELEAIIRGQPLQPYTQSRITAPLVGGLLGPQE